MCMGKGVVHYIEVCSYGDEEEEEEQVQDGEKSNGKGENHRYKI